MAKLKAGVIGLGMGYNHLRGYMTHPDVEVVAVADRQEGRRERAKQEFQIEKVYAEGIDLIRNEKLDILSVAVPNSQHKELTIAGLKAGAHVFCEKPMAMNAAEAEEMLATAKECNRQLGIDFSYRFTPQSRAMKALVEEGRLGEIYYARSVWLRRRGVPGGTGKFPRGKPLQSACCRVSAIPSPGPDCGGCLPPCFCCRSSCAFYRRKTGDFSPIPSFLPDIPTDCSAPCPVLCSIP